MTIEIPGNWLEKVDKREYQEALSDEAVEMILGLSVYLEIEQPDQDQVIIALSSRWRKPVDEIVNILSAFVRFKARLSLFDSIYGEPFDHDEAGKLLLVPDVVELIVGSSGSQEVDLIKKSQKEMAEAEIHMEWMDIRFEYLS